MNQTCDRCGPAVHAGSRVNRVNRAGELYLCGPCASRHWRALSAQGWTFWPLGVHPLAPQARGRSTRRPGVAAGAGAAAGLRGRAGRSCRPARGGQRDRYRRARGNGTALHRDAGSPGPAPVFWA